MKNDEGKGFFGIGLDLSQLEEGKVKALSIFNDIEKQARESGNALDESFVESIENINRELTGITPDFGERIQTEIDKNIDAFDDLQEKVADLRQAKIDMGVGEETQRVNQLNADIDAMINKQDEYLTLSNEANINDEAEKERLLDISKRYGFQIQKNREELDLLEESDAYKEQQKQLTKVNSELGELGRKSLNVEGTVESLKTIQTEYTDAVKLTTEEMRRTVEEQDKLGDGQSTLQEIFDQSKDSIEGLGSATTLLPAPLRKVVGGIKSVTKASWKFIATPIGAIIGAIVLGLTALYNWFNKTADGQIALTKATGYMTGILDGLREVLFAVGKALYDTFTNPQEAVKKLWEVIKENLINRLEGMGAIFKSLGKIISSGFTEGYDDLGKAFVKTATGVDDLIGKTEKYIGKIKNIAEETSKLAVAEELLAIERSKWGMKEAELDAQIARKRNEMRSGATDEARKQSALEMNSLIEKKYDKQIGFAKEELRITAERNKLVEKGQEDLNKENDLRANLSRVETAKLNELGRSQRVLGGIARKDHKSSMGEVNTLEKAQEKYFEKLASLQAEVTKQEHEANKDTLTGRMELIDAEYNYQLELIQKRKEAFIQDSEGLDVDTSSFDALMAFLLEKRVKQEADYLNEIVKTYATAEEKRDEIINKYAKDRADLEKSGASEERLAVVDEQEQAELAKFDTLMQDKASIMTRMFGEMSDKSVDEIKAIRNEAKDLLAFLTSDGGWDAEKGAIFGITKEMFEDIASDPEKLDKYRVGIEKVEKAILQLDSPIQLIKDGLADIFDPKNAGTDKIIKGLEKIEKGYKQYADAVGLVSGAVGALGDLAGSETLSTIAEGLEDVLAVADEAMAGAKMGAQFGAVGAVVGGVLGAVKGLATVFSRNKQHREELRKIIEENKKAEYFGQLEIESIWRSKYEWSRKIGESTLKHLKREGEELKKQGLENEKQQASLWGKLRDEQYKSGEHFKKTGLFGWGKGKIVEEWSSLASKSLKDIEELASQGKLSEEGMKYFEALKNATDEGEKLKQQALEAAETWREIYSGTSYDGLVSGIVSAFTQGKRSAKDFADSFEELLEGAVLSSIQLMANEDMRGWYEKFAQKNDEGMTEADLEELRNDWVTLNENLVNKAEMMEKAMGVEIGGVEKQRGASVGAYEKVTQEQWSQTDGLFRGMHLVAIENSDYLKSISGWGENVNDMRNIAIDSHFELVGINKNTKLLLDTNEILGDMKRNGIKML